LYKNKIKIIFRDDSVRVVAFGTLPSSAPSAEEDYGLEAAVG
jgi:hypothetical protein